MTPHSAGVWRVNGSTVVSDRHDPRLYCGPEGSEQMRRAHAAYDGCLIAGAIGSHNASLIAAAPDLVAALVEAVGCIDQDQPFPPWFSAAEAALAKARGR